MALPIRTTIDDVEAISSYLAKKPTGAMLGDARKVLDSKYLDGRKLSAYRYWGIVEDEGGRMKLSPLGRSFAKSDQTSRPALLDSVIQQIAPYRAIVERAAHRREESFTATEVAAHWHQHFPGEVADSDKVLNDQAVCFFQLAQGAGLGSIVMGRHGLETRFQFNSSAVQSFVESADRSNKEEPQDIVEPPVPLIADVKHGSTSNSAVNPVMTEDRSKQAIFVAHGKNKKPLEQLKGILEQFKIPYRVATEEPNLGRPIGPKFERLWNPVIVRFSFSRAMKNSKTQKGIKSGAPAKMLSMNLGRLVISTVAE